jgi:hypothetical protein
MWKVKALNSLLAVHREEELPTRDLDPLVSKQFGFQSNGLGLSRCQRFSLLSRIDAGGAGRYCITVLKGQTKAMMLWAKKVPNWHQLVRTKKRELQYDL